MIRFKGFLFALCLFLFLTASTRSQNVKDLVSQGDRKCDAERYEEGLDLYERAMKIAGPLEKRDIQYKIGECYTFFDFRGAEHTFLSLVRTDPRWIDPYEALSRMYDNSGLFDKSLDIIKKGLLNNPNHYRLYTRMGVSYVKQENYQAAAAAFEKSIAAAPSSPDAYDALGIVYRKYLNRPDDAIKMLEKAVALGIKGGETQYELCLLYTFRNRRRREPPG